MPPHWFRLTLFNDTWSGAFRIDNRIYFINRFNSSDTVDVRPANHGDSSFLALARIRVSAIVDEQYVDADTIGDNKGMDNLGHLFALESIHILDGLITDSFGITLVLEQLIYQPSALLSSDTNGANALDGAEQWSNLNAEAFGLTDNLATLFFRGALPGGNEQSAVSQSNDHIAILGNTADYQLATTHAFGQLLGLSDEPGTVQQWYSDNGDSLPYALWSNRHGAVVENTAFPDLLLQSISNDAPEIAEPTPDDTSGEIDQQLVIAEEPEADGLIADDNARGIQFDTPNANPGGGGAASLYTFLLLMLSLYFRRRYALNC